MPHKTLSIFILFIGISIQAAGQQKISLAAGVGFPELLNAGIRFNGKQSQFGVSVGTFPAKNETTRSFCADLFLHFGRDSKLSSRKPWFFKFGVNHFRSESVYLIENYTYMTPEMGREFNFSKKIGIEVHAGVAIQLFERIVDKQPTGFDLDISFPLLPAFGLSTFYKI